MANPVDGNSLLDKLNELTGYRDELLSQKDSIETDITDLKARIAELKEDLEKNKEELNNKIQESHDIDNNIRTAESTLLKVAGVLNRGENNNNKMELDEEAREKAIDSSAADFFNPQIEPTNYSFNEPITEKSPFGTSAIDFSGYESQNEKFPESLEHISLEPEYKPFEEPSIEKPDTNDNDGETVDYLFNNLPEIQTTSPTNDEVIPTLENDMVNGSDYNSIAQNLENLQSGEEKVYDMTQEKNPINDEGIMVGSSPNIEVSLGR